MDSINKFPFFKNENSFPNIGIQPNSPTIDNKGLNVISFTKFQNQIFIMMQNKKETLLKHIPSLLKNAQIFQKSFINNTENNIKIFNSLLSHIQQPNESFNIMKKCKDSHLINQNNEVKLKKNKKFSEEDEILKKVVHSLGPKNWRIIASFIPGRNQRQCRDRYANYLAPGFIQTKWTEKEDKLLAEKYNIYGPKWTQIRQFFPYRTANSIKNRYNYTISRKFNVNQSETVNNEQFNKKENDDIDKDLNDIFSDIGFISENSNQINLFNEELQINEFDYSFINY